MTAILVTGGAGQLAQGVKRARPAGVTVTGRPDFDFERPETIAATIRAANPALVINAAAYTAVDLAESQPEAAARANATGPGLVAETCFALGIPLIHVSTDYVFDGTKGAPYHENDPTNPTGVYGATKLAGEHAVRAAHPGAVILRTSWVYATHGKNFAITMIRAGRRNPILRVVADQLGCPTNADDLAVACLAVADQLLAQQAIPGKEHDLAGVYHAAGTGQTSWHGFATAIFHEAVQHGWQQPPIHAIATADWPTPARRPADSRLDCTRLETVFGVRLPAWRDSLGPAIAAICDAETEAQLATVGG